MHIIFSLSKDEKVIYSEFEYVYYAVRYMKPKEKSANNEWVNNSLDCGFSKILSIYVYFNIVAPLRMEII